MPALVVIRSSSKQIDYQENRSVWRRARGPDDRGQSDSDNGDDSADGDHDRDVEEANGQPPPPSRLGAGYGLSTELRDMEGLNAFRCADCGVVVADRDDVVSKTFFGRTGKAFLMNNMYNVRAGPARNRYLMTGMHTIADVACAQCDAVLGWKYVKAMETSQKYKEGKFIMEHAVVQDDWEERAWDRLE